MRKNTAPQIGTLDYILITSTSQYLSFFLSVMFSSSSTSSSTSLSPEPSDGISSVGEGVTCVGDGGVSCWVVGL